MTEELRRLIEEIEEMEDTPGDVGNFQAPTKEEWEFADEDQVFEEVSVEQLTEILDNLSVEEVLDVIENIESVDALENVIDAIREWSKDKFTEAKESKRFNNFKTFKY